MLVLQQMAECAWLHPVCGGYVPLQLGHSFNNVGYHSRTLLCRQIPKTW